MADSRGVQGPLQKGTSEAAEAPPHREWALQGGLPDRGSPHPTVAEQAGAPPPHVGAVVGKFAALVGAVPRTQQGVREEDAAGVADALAKHPLDCATGVMGVTRSGASGFLMGPMEREDAAAAVDAPAAWPSDYATGRNVAVPVGVIGFPEEPSREDAASAADVPAAGPLDGAGSSMDAVLGGATGLLEGPRDDALEDESGR